MKNKRIKSMLEAMDEELPRALANEAKVEILLAEISHLQNRLWMSKRDARKVKDFRHGQVVKESIVEYLKEFTEVSTDPDNTRVVFMNPRKESGDK